MKFVYFLSFFLNYIFYFLNKMSLWINAVYCFSFGSSYLNKCNMISITRGPKMSLQKLILWKRSSHHIQIGIDCQLRLKYFSKIKMWVLIYLLISLFIVFFDQYGLPIFYLIVYRFNIILYTCITFLNTTYYESFKKITVTHCTVSEI